ncbi:Pentatricopeptide repeat-containing protein [Durusdinium trenchii]|uniref:Mitochondrial n=1 Tax=Durusdinium trenchii TaxID=1381693 RepID=A0ABP0Q599_9DINO
MGSCNFDSFQDWLFTGQRLWWPRAETATLELSGLVLDGVLRFSCPAVVAVLRSSSKSMLRAAEGLPQFPTWPLLLVLTTDGFVRAHQPSLMPEFVVELRAASLRAVQPSQPSSHLVAVHQGAQSEVTAELARDWTLSLGRMSRALGTEGRLWEYPRNPCKACVADFWNPDEWMYRQVEMQCSPCASRQLLLIDSYGQVFLRHTFLDPEVVLWGVGAKRRTDADGMPLDHRPADT